MSLWLVAEKDLVDEYRAYTLWVYLLPFVVIFGIGGYTTGLGARVSSASATLAASMAGLTSVLVPLAALVVAHESVAGERDAGTARMLLAYPHSRRDVVLGLALGRAVLLVGLFDVGYVLAAVAFAVSAGLPDFAAWFQLVAVGSLYAASFAVIVVGVSAAVATTWQALTLVIAALAGFGIAWDALPGLVLWALNGFRGPAGPLPEWGVIFQQLDPFTAYQHAAGSLLGSVGGPAAFYASELFGLLLLVAWPVLLVLLGLRRFEGADL